MENISFPALGLNLHINRVAFSIGSYPIAWYGIIIAVGLLLALLYGMKVSKRYKITTDDLSDVVIFSIIFGIIGARLYYCLFFVDSYGTNPYFQDPLSMIYIWEGGLGIYGGMIAAFITAFVVCKIKKISVGAVFDIASLGFLIGQAIGRWGNFINQEAYGSETTLPWGMQVAYEQNPVHPCFLYESLWCILGFVLLHIYSKHRKFNGEIFLMYISWYAFGRYFIEALRTDSLMIGNLKISQVVAVVLFIASLALLIYKRVKINKENIENSIGYESLFDDTAKAVEADTKQAEKEILGDDGSIEDDDNNENLTEETSADVSSDDEIEQNADEDTPVENEQEETSSDNSEEK